MKMMRYLLLATVVIGLFSMGAYAQKRKTPTKRTTATPKAATLPPLEVRAARVKVSNQYSNLSAFVSGYGPVAAAIEALDTEAKSGKVSKQSMDKNAANKTKLITAIRGIREGMMKLESEFRVKPDLKKYLLNIQGISDLAGQSETSAVAGKFVAASAPLRTIQQKLNDTLTAMPNAEL